MTALQLRQVTQDQDDEDEVMIYVEKWAEVDRCDGGPMALVDDYFTVRAEHERGALVLIADKRVE